MDMKKAMGPWPHPAPMVRALGAGWMDANQVQPWEDTDSRLRYVVYSPPYLGALLVCVALWMIIVPSGRKRGVPDGA